MLKERGNQQRHGHWEAQHMKRILVGLGSVVLVACGGTAKIGGGKEGVAQAFFAASSATSAGANRSGQPLDVTGSLSWDCPHGGTASLSGFGLQVGTQPDTKVNQSFTVKYNNCGAAKSNAGVAVFNGSFTVTQSITADDTGAVVDQTFKGRVEVGGAFNDFIEADVKQLITVAGLSSTQGLFNMKLVGTIKTSTDSYTYNEMVSVTAGGDISVSVNGMR
jgi:hypothetical protein